MKPDVNKIIEHIKAAYEEEEARIAAMDNVIIEIKIKADKDFNLSAFNEEICDFLDDEPDIKWISSSVSRE